MASQFGLLATGLLAVASGWLTWTLLNLAPKRPTRLDAKLQLEDERRETLRASNTTYRQFEVLIDELVAVNALFFDERQLVELSKAFAIVPGGVRWKPLEYVACKQLEGVLAGTVVAGICLFGLNLLWGLVVGLGVAWIYVHAAIQSVKQQFAARLQAVKRRLPFAVDLMALMLEAGAGFLESLKTVVRENASHPLGDELGIVVTQVELGRTRREALEGFRQRCEDQDIDDFVSAVNTGEELGTPLGTIMQTQADQMRLKRAQWGEKAAAEAQVQMTFPSMVVMLACMLLILAPFVLPPLLKIL